MSESPYPRPSESEMVQKCKPGSASFGRKFQILCETRSVADLANMYLRMEYDFWRLAESSRVIRELAKKASE